MVRSRSRPSAGTRSPWSTRRWAPRHPRCRRRTRGGRRTRRWAPRRANRRRGLGPGREIQTRGERATRWTTAITGRELGRRTTSYRGRTLAWVRRLRNPSRTPRTFEGPSPGSMTIRVEFLLKVRSVDVKVTLCVTTLDLNVRRRLCVAQPPSRPSRRPTHPSALSATARSLATPSISLCSTLRSCARTSSAVEGSISAHRDRSDRALACSCVARKDTERRHSALASSGSSSSSFSSLAIAAACSPDRCSAAARFSVVFRLRSYTASCSAGSKPLRPSKLRTVFSYLDLASASLPPASSSFPSSLSFLASSSIAERLARCQLTGLSKLTSSATNSSATVSFPVNFAKAAKTAAAPGWSSPTYPCLGCRASFRVTRDTSPGTASLNDVSSASGRVPHPSVNSRGSPVAFRVSNTGSSSSEKPLKPTEGRTRTEKCARHAQSCTGQSAGNSPAPSFSLRLNTMPSPKRSRTWTMDSSANSNSTPAATPAAGTRRSQTTTSSRYAPGSHHTTHRSPTLMVSTAAERGAGSVPSPLTHRTRVLGANTDAFGPSSFGSIAHARPTSSRTISNGGLGLSQPSPSLVTVLCTTGAVARSPSSSLVRPPAPSARVRVASIRIRVASPDARTDSTSSQMSSSTSTPRGHGRARGWRYAYVGRTRTTHRSPMDVDASASARPLTHSCPG
mmetsp:Transcript_12017/g.50543  ORF Transcript_12017/g.50543 Transcript_12017/m.50543 type:complete len:679 (+) Transcript_12017:2793-4829(+)